jgi:hypothetical protein
VTWKTLTKHWLAELLLTLAQVTNRYAEKIAAAADKIEPRKGNR